MNKKLIKINTAEEFDSLLNKGYEVVNRYYRLGNDGSGGTAVNFNYGIFFLKKMVKN